MLTGGYIYPVVNYNINPPIFTSDNSTASNSSLTSPLLLHYNPLQPHLKQGTNDFGKEQQPYTLPLLSSLYSFNCQNNNNNNNSNNNNNNNNFSNNNNNQKNGFFTTNLLPNLGQSKPINQNNNNNNCNNCNNLNNHFHNQTSYFFGNNDNNNNNFNNNKYKYNDDSDVDMGDDEEEEVILKSPSLPQQKIPTSSTPSPVRKIPKTPITKTPTKRYIDSYGMLYSVGGNSDAYEYSINRKSFSIGSRRENDVVILSNSRKTYASISVERGGILTITNQSRYPIKINGLEMMRPSHELSDGDHIRIKHTTLLFRLNPIHKVDDRNSNSNNNNNSNNYSTRRSNDSSEGSPRLFSNNTTPTYSESFSNSPISSPIYKPRTTTTTTTTTTKNNRYISKSTQTELNIQEKQERQLPLPKSSLDHSIFEQLKRHQNTHATEGTTKTNNNLNSSSFVNDDHNKQLVSVDYIFRSNIVINIGPENNITDYKSFLEKKNISKSNSKLFKGLKIQIIRSTNANLSDLIEHHGGQVVNSSSMLDEIKIIPENTFFDYMKHKKSCYYKQPSVSELWASESIKNKMVLPFEKFLPKAIKPTGSIFLRKKFCIYPPEYDFNLISCQYIDSIKSYYYGSGQSKYNQLKKDFESEIIHYSGEIVSYHNLNISKVSYILVLDDIPQSEVVKLNSYKLVTVKWFLDCKEQGRCISHPVDSLIKL